MTHTNETAIDLDWYPLSDEDIRQFDQEQTLLDKLSPLGEYLVGEPFKKLN